MNRNPEKYICIHGHFYQPPRENPWLESIELQDSAYPYHDWNERVTAESYAPNAASRILKDGNRIVQIVNNYARISFNFGPTLLAWMKPHAPDVYEAVLEADRESQRRFSGHGSALAQAYNHMIMPLANRRDKYTQALWGIRDFERRFGRAPEGMWLPEAAVDIETLDVLAELGIKFTVLAPHQASRERRIGRRGWHDRSGGRINPTRAYIHYLPSGRTIDLFFYDGPIARGVAFERLLDSGEGFAHRLTGAFSQAQSEPQLVHIATDGETYGHHHKYGEMALAYALHHIESNNLARLTNYGEFLEKHPPADEVEIFENTSWSCAHGVERWRSDCGCNNGGRPGWSQGWRAPLRAAFDWLRDSLAPRYETLAAALLIDPWAARDDYIEVVLDRSEDNVRRFMDKHALRPLSHNETVAALKLLELQRNLMLTYASCGWFFDELSGIETAQVMRYAGRAVQLAQEVFSDDPDILFLESQLLDLLEQAKSNVPEHGDGRRIYEKWVRPAKVDLSVVTAHYAISSLFEHYGERERVNAYTMRRQDYRAVQPGRTRLAVGRVEAASEVTTESGVFTFGVLHFGDHTLNAGVGRFRGEDAYQAMAEELSQAFAAGDYTGIVRLLDKHFGGSTYSLRTLFSDEQRKVMSRVLESALSEAEAAYRQLYDNNYPLMRFLIDMGEPLPKAFLSDAQFILNTDLRRAISDGTLATDPATVLGLLEEVKLWNVDIDTAGLSYHLRLALEQMMAAFSSAPDDISMLRDLNNAVTVSRSMPVEAHLWKVQNLYYEVLQSAYPTLQARAQRGDESAREWLGLFVSLGERLSIHVG